MIPGGEAGETREETVTVGVQSNEEQAQAALRDTRKDNPPEKVGYKLSVYVECPCGCAGNIMLPQVVGTALSGKPITVRCNVCGQLLNMHPEFQIAQKVPQIHMASPVADIKKAIDQQMSRRHF